MKRIKILLIALILILGGAIFSNTYADSTETSSTRKLKASLTRPFEDSTYNKPQYKYKVKGSTNTDVQYTVVKIYDADDVTNGTNNYSKPFYCLRGGIGFGADDVSEDEVDYTEVGEMHKDADTIIESYLSLFREQPQL